MQYAFAVIRSFANKDTEKVWREERTRRWPPALQQAALRKLILLHTAERLEEMSRPATVWRNSVGTARASTAFA